VYIRNIGKRVDEKVYNRERKNPDKVVYLSVTFSKKTKIPWEKEHSVETKHRYYPAASLIQTP
jgi:hypothetical protein